MPGQGVTWWQRQLQSNMNLFKTYLFLFLSISGGILAQEYNQHRWKERVLVIHGTSEDDEEVVAQLALMKTDKAALEDLKLVIHMETVSEIQYHCTDEVIVATKEKPIFSPFKVELYGLDGELKFSSHELVQMAKLYEVINSMPMRRSELRERNKG